MADGTGTTITFGTSGFSAQVLEEISGPSVSVESIEIPLLADTWARRIPAKLKSAGEVSFSVRYSAPCGAVIGVTEAITITPEGSGSSITFNGFISTLNPTFARGQDITAEMTVVVDGQVSGY